jgi:hypothetical protein
MLEIASQIAANLAQVRQKIADVAARCGRRGEEIRLVAVTKYVGPAEVRALVEAGCTELGESRPQQLWEKAAALEDLPVRWHLVGPLQRNKIRRTLPLVTLIHSADSPRLVAALDQAAAEAAREKMGTGSAQPQPTPGSSSCDKVPVPIFSPHRVPILLEVNISGEPAKHGFAPGAIEPVLEELAGYRHVEVRGLMCMASLAGGLDAARRDFAALRQYRDRLRGYCPAGIELNELSMGMSGDYAVAIEEGATIVRIGSALFQGVVR